MVVDTSALIAILQAEPEAGRLTLAIGEAPVAYIAAPTLVQSIVVVQRRFGARGERELDRLVAEFRLEVVAFSLEHVEIARESFRRFGKGTHAAALNYGDTFSYAVARALMEPLLYVGADFDQTDVEVARY